MQSFLSAVLAVKHTFLYCPSRSRLLVHQDGGLAPSSERADRRISPPNSTKHRPAATLSFLLVTQLQFLAVLSLVRYTTTEEDSLLADFVIGLR